MKKNIKAFGLLALSIVLGTFVSEAVHSRLDQAPAANQTGAADPEPDSRLSSR